VWETIASFAKRREFWLVVAWIVTIVAVVIVVALWRSPATVDQLIVGVFDIAPTPAEPEPALWAVFRQVASECQENPQFGGCLQLYERLLDLDREQREQESDAECDSGFCFSSEGEV
jgi:hypothetical protein